MKPTMHPPPIPAPSRFPPPPPLRRIAPHRISFHGTTTSSSTPKDPKERRHKLLTERPCPSTRHEPKINTQVLFVSTRWATPVSTHVWSMKQNRLGVLRCRVHITVNVTGQLLQFHARGSSLGLARGPPFQHGVPVAAPLSQGPGLVYMQVKRT